MGEWIIPFEGRNYSGTYKQNFLFKKDNLYIMDNHRAALWCWMQHLNDKQEINLFHIDCHYDTLYSRMDEWLKIYPNVKKQTIEEYLQFSYDIDGVYCHLFRWDNYLSIFLEQHADQIHSAYFSTHGEGDKPKFNNIMHIEPWDLPYNFSDRLEDSKYKFIVNIDLDYFVFPKTIDDENKKELFSQDYLKSIFIPLREQIEKNNVLVITICLSPECTGGWRLAEKICKDICDILNIQFTLPK